jgi:phage-related protein
MSLFYNRDRNITGAVPLASFDFKPNYGSSIEFSCKNNKIAYNNNTYSLVPSTLNNIVGNCNFNFTVGTGDAQKIINFFESQSGTGYFAINDNSQIYRTLNGFANNFSISMNGNNLYNIDLAFSVERNSSFLDWSGMSFVNYDFKNWRIGAVYEKYQPVYFETQKDSLIKNFFYAKQTHTSSYSNLPTNEEFWTQDFFYENDFGLSVNTEPAIDYLNFKNSFTQRIKSQDNINSFKKIGLSYKNISDFKLKSMLHFLESHLGYMKFRFDSPQIYNRPKIFYAETWSHSWNYKDSNNLTVNLVEDPLGILNQINTPNVCLYQNSAGDQITGQASALDGLFLVDYSGKKIASQNGDFGVIRGDSNIRTTKFYQDLELLSGCSQKINRISFGERSNLRIGLFTGNSLSGINFNGAKNIEFLDLRDNSISNFNCDNVTGLKRLDLRNNNLTGISVSSCNELNYLQLRYTNLTDPSFSNLLYTISTGNAIGGIISIFKNVSGNSDRLFNVSNLDYKDWTQLYSDLNLPFEPTGYVDAGVKTFWYKNSQARETGDPYFLNWQSSREPNTMYQEYSPSPENWFYPQSNEIGIRSTYKFNKTFLSGSGYNNTGDYLAAFLIAKINSTGDMCLMNFSPNKNYGLYQSNGSLVFRNQGAQYTISGEGLALGRYYSIGFWRRTDAIVGFINGVQRQTLATKSNISSITPCIGASGKNSNENYFDGNIAEALVYSNNSEFSLDPTFHYNFNSRFGILNGYL